MTKTPAVRHWLAGIVLLLGSVTPALAQAPAAADMLNAKLAPKFDDINITTPSESELRSCRVELIKGSVPGSSGWVLKMGDQTLRRFFDSTGKGKVDLWSYYKEGVEVYREFDTTGKGVPNNFRWLNSAGMKWGVGGVSQGKGYVSAWRMISAEEVSYEAFQAVLTKDYSRLQALFISENEVVMLKLSAIEGKKVLARQQAAQRKFSDLIAQDKLAGAKFETIEGGIPSCETHGDIETIKFSDRSVRYQIGKNSSWLHTGELIQVGMAWRLTDAPSTEIGGGGGITPPANQKLQELLQKLAKIDERNVPMGAVLAKLEAIEQFYRERIAIIQQIIPLDKASEREGWYKQLFDNLTAMAQNSGDATTIVLQNKLRDDVATQMPGSNLAAYGTYRCMWTKYAIDMANAQKLPDGAAKKIADLQDKWHDSLVDFVKRYPKADDSPEALHQIAIGCEFSGKNEEGKRWYAKLVEDFPEHHFAPRSRGSVARLSLVGNPLKLAGPDLATKQPFDVASLKNKIVIVHYWSSITGSHVGDFAQLQRIINLNGAKNGVELVSICLDDTEAQAKAAVSATKAPGTHLFLAPANNAGGLNSSLAIQYGIHILPTVFIVGRDGRVASNSVQIGDLDTELKKVQ